MVALKCLDLSALCVRLGLLILKKAQKIHIASSIAGSRFFLCDILGKFARRQTTLKAAESMETALEEILDGELVSPRFSIEDRLVPPTFKEQFSDGTLTTIHSMHVAADLYDLA
jgi:hypothetical protein